MILPIYPPRFQTSLGSHKSFKTWYHSAEPLGTALPAQIIIAAISPTFLPHFVLSSQKRSNPVLQFSKPSWVPPESSRDLWCDHFILSYPTVPDCYLYTEHKQGSLLSWLTLLDLLKANTAFSSEVLLVKHHKAMFSPLLLA